MKELIGLGLMIIGVLVGFYVGIWICLVGGIMDIVELVKSDAPIESSEIIWAVVKIALREMFACITALFFILPGAVLLNN